MLATSDLHGWLMPFDYDADIPRDDAGLTRTATLIAAARAGCACSVLLDNGDILQGSALAQRAASRRRHVGVAHPVIAAMNHLGYDAANVGNHDFNYGLPVLARAIAEARFPFVLANLTWSSQGDAGQGPPPFTLIDRTLRDGSGRIRALRLGIVGVTPPQAMVWDRGHLRGRARVRDMAEAATEAVAAARSAGAGLVILLAHTGLGNAGAPPMSENAGIVLGRVSGADAMVLGHSHRVWPGPGAEAPEGADPTSGTVGGIPAVMPGRWGSHLGVIDLRIAPENGRWRVCGHRCVALPVTGDADGLPVTDHSGIHTLARAAHAATRRHVARRIGSVRAPLHSFLALAAETPALSIVADAQRAHVERALRGGPHDGLPVLSAAAPFKSGGRGGPSNYTHIPPGDVRLRHVADLYPFPNAIRAVRIRGADLRLWLERSAAVFRRIAPGSQDEPLLDRDVPGHSFDTIDGVTWRIDLSAPPRFTAAGTIAESEAWRIIDLRHRGVPVREGDEFVVATNSYRATGAEDVAGIPAGSVILEESTPVSEIVQRHIADLPHLRAERRGTWSFAPMPGTSVIYETSPAVLEHPEDLQAVAAEPAGMTDDGFLRLRLQL